MLLDVPTVESPHKALEYYATDPDDVRAFLDVVELTADEDPRLLPLVTPGSHVLDPSAGGCARNVMPYPLVFRERGLVVTTMDKREDSRAEFVVDFLEDDAPGGDFDAVGTNPPFRPWRRFVERATELCRPGAPIALLLNSRIEEPPARGEPGSKQRAKHDEFVRWWRRYRPAWRFVHGRLKFGRSGTANDLYAHFVWFAGEEISTTRTRPVTDALDLDDRQKDLFHGATR